MTDITSAEQEMTLHGRYRFKKYKSLADNSDVPLKDREVIWEGPWIDNLVMKSTSTGIGLIARRLAGDTTYDIVVTQASIGTGTTAPADADTNLQTPVLTGILPAIQSSASNSAAIEFFMAAGSLANGTYTEFGIFCGTQLLARSIISPSYTKATGEDTGVEYTITIANT